MKKTLLALLAIFGFAEVNNSLGQCTVSDQSLSATPTTFTCQGTSMVTIPVTEMGVSYYLSDSASGSRISDYYYGGGASVSIPTGNITSSTTIYVIGERQLSSVGLDFDGVDDYVQITPMIPMTTDFTVEAMVNAGSTNGAIFSWGDAATGNYTSLNLSGGANKSLKLFIGDGVNPQYQLSGTTVINDGMWHHVAVSKSGPVVVLYVDGNVEATGFTTNVTIPSTTSIGGGFHNGVWQSNFLGQIDEVRVWDIARTGTDIMNDRWNCLQGTEPNLVAYYQFEDGTSSTVLSDATANAYNGTLNLMDPALDWTFGSSVCGQMCSATMSSVVHIVIDPIVDQSVMAVIPEFCTAPGSTTIDLGASETGIDYYLRDNSNNAVIDGPVAGTGGPLALSTGTVNTTTTYNVYANVVNPSTGVNITGGAIYPNGNNLTFTEFTAESWYKDMASVAYATDPCLFIVYNEVGNNPQEAIGVFTNMTSGLPYLMYVNFTTGPGTPSAFGTTNLLDGTFHHVAIVANATSGNYELIVDGAMETSLATTLTQWFGGFVGAFDPVSFSSGSAFGVYDDIRFWDIPRSPTQITSDKDNCLIGGAPNLVGYWPVDDASGKIISEVSGSGLAGSLDLEGTEGVEFVWTTGNTQCTVCELQMSQLASVSIGDTSAPNVVCQNITVQLDAAGTASIVAGDIDGGTTDNCDSNPVLSADITSFTCADLPLFDTALVITAAYDGPLTGGVPKGIELYALADIADLSLYGISSANNGSGTTGAPEFTFPAVAIAQGSYIYVASEAVEFANFFGFSPDYTSSSMSINGDDAIELFYQGNIIDVFGDVNTDGTGQPWDYMDGWAYRTNSTGPDGTTFDLNNWSLSGINQLEGGTTNGTTTSPVPVGTYTYDAGVAVTLTATDADNNTASCVAMVTVVDQLSPVFSNCPANISVNANVATCSAVVSWVAPTATDNCGVDTVYSSHNVTDTFALGTTVVTYYAEDASGNVASCSFDVTVTNDMVANAVATDVSCFGTSSGSIDLTVTGGTGTYSYEWDNGDANEDPASLIPGTYNVNVTDGIGCTATASATVGSPSAISIGSSFVDPTACQAADGSVSITVTGGTVATGYSYNWSNGATTQNITGQLAGSYSVVVTDDNGCQDSVTVGLTDPNAPTLTMIVTPTILNCYGDANGTMEVLVSYNGGATSATYLWDNGSTFTTIPLLTAGTHTVTVTDNNNCVATASGTITQPDSVSGMGIVTDALCYNDANGAINLAAFGGTESNLYNFNWSNGATTEDLTGITAGTYTVTITDDNGCTGTVSFFVNQPDSIAGNASVTDITCNGDVNGAISLMPTGGDGNYSYSWATGETSQSLTGLAQNTYTVTITDGNGCTGGDSYVVNEPAVLAVTGTTTNDSTGSSGGVNITVTGGTMPYGYSWDNSSTTEDLTNVAGNATYTVTVTDANGCIVSNSFTVTSTVGIEESLIFTNVYPNPTNGMLFIELSINNFEVELTDLDGRIVYNEQIRNSNKVTINMEDLAKGIYVLQVKENTNSYQLKVVKQ